MNLQQKIPDMLTRRNCASKVAEAFDLTGKVGPLISLMKLDLHNLVRLNIGWDDVGPDNLRNIWLDNFKSIQEMKILKYRRAIVPEDAESLMMDTVDFGDASKSLACSAIYARFKMKSGGYSCQLVIARSKITPEDTSQPRAELITALLNAHTGEEARRAFGKYQDGHLKLTDSQIVLYWLTNEEKPQNQWVSKFGKDWMINLAALHCW